MISLPGLPDFFVILSGIVVLGVLVFVHEFGHFLLAKANGIGVLAFSIGFGPKVWKKRIGETTYAIGIIPLGGYVRMVGDDPRDAFGASLPDPTGEFHKTEGANEAVRGMIEQYDDVDQALLNDRNKWFLSKGYFAKMSVVLAGPGFNFLFAILASIASIYSYGDVTPIDKPIIGDIRSNFPAEKAGLKDGDEVVSIDGKPLLKWEDLAGTVRASGGKEMAFIVKRDSRNFDLKITAVPDSALPSDEGKDSVFRIGIGPKVERHPVTLGDSIEGGFSYVWFLTKQTVYGIKGMLVGKISADNIAGPIFIFNEAGKNAKKGLEALVSFMVFLSVSLAVLNLLPVPILDGGHLVFFTLEAIKGSPLNIRFLEICNRVGATILFALIVFSLGNDIWRHFK